MDELRSYIGRLCDREAEAEVKLAEELLQSSDPHVRMIAHISLRIFSISESVRDMSDKLEKLSSTVAGLQDDVASKISEQDSRIDSIDESLDSVRSYLCI